MAADSALTRQDISKFWFPLWLTWFMMAVEGPFLASLVARLDNPTANLAAHGVAIAIGWIVEAPIMMILSATVALASSAAAFERIRNFTYFLNGTITLVMVILAFTPAFDVLIGFLNLTSEVSELIRKGLIFLIPWPAAIGFRRLYQGILIRRGRTRAVAVGTVIRLVSMAGGAMLYSSLGTLSGVEVSAAALSTGVVFEWFAAYYFARRDIRSLPSSSPDENVMTYLELGKYYLPLMLTSLISLISQPLLTFFLGQSRMAIESLALVPVLSSFIFLFKTVGISYQEVVIALAGRKQENLPLLQGTAIRMGLALSALFFVIVITPLSYFWFGYINGLPDLLYELVELPAQISFLLPLAAISYAFYAATAIVRRKNTFITYATVAEVLVIVATLIVGIFVFDAVGILVGAAALLFGRSTSAIFLAIQYHFPKNNVQKSRTE